MNLARTTAAVRGLNSQHAHEPLSCQVNRLLLVLNSMGIISAASGGQLIRPAEIGRKPVKRFSNNSCLGQRSGP